MKLPLLSRAKSFDSIAITLKYLKIFKGMNEKWAVLGGDGSNTLRVMKQNGLFQDPILPPLIETGVQYLGLVSLIAKIMKPITCHF